jgi:hypothetical protein
VGVGLTAVFGAGAAALARFTEARGEGDGGAVAANGAIVAAAELVCVLGFVAITHSDLSEEVVNAGSAPAAGG